METKAIISMDEYDELIMLRNIHKNNVVYIGEYSKIWTKDEAVKEIAEKCFELQQKLGYVDSELRSLLYDFDIRRIEGLFGSIPRLTKKTIKKRIKEIYDKLVFS